MASSIVELLIRAKNEASKPIDEASKSLEGLGKSSDGAEKSTGSFSDTWAMTLLGINQGIQIIQQVGQALQQAFDFTYEGAQIIQTEAAFGSMANTIGMSTGVLSEWRDAVNGTVSDMELMTGFQTLAAGLSKEMTAAFAENNVKLLEIAKAASALNPMLGDTAFMYESITRGIKRSSPLILDNLGIVVKVGEANQKYADAIGKTVDELTAEEKQMALLNEVLKSGDTLINQLGGSVEAATDPWDRYTAAVKNNTSSLKSNIASFEGFEQILTAAADNMEDMYTVTELVSKATEYGIITNKEYDEIIRAGRRGKEVDIELTDDLKKRIIAYDAAVDQTAESLIKQSIAAVLAGESMDGLVSSTENLTGYYQTIMSLSDSYTDKLAAIGDKQERINDLQEIMATGGYIDGGYISATKANEEIGKLQGEIGDLRAAMASMANQVVIDMATAEAAIDGIISEDEFTAIQNLKVGLGEMSREAADEAIKQFARAKAYWDAMQFNAKNTEVYVRFSYSNAYETGGFGSGREQGIERNNASGGIIEGMAHAAGGYIVGEVGPEPFFPAENGRILSNTEARNAMKEGGGKGVTIVLNYSPAVSFADKAEAEEVLLPYIRDNLFKLGVVTR